MADQISYHSGPCPVSVCRAHAVYCEIAGPGPRHRRPVQEVHVVCRALAGAGRAGPLWLRQGAFSWHTYSTALHRLTWNRPWLVHQLVRTTDVRRTASPFGQFLGGVFPLPIAKYTA